MTKFEGICEMFMLGPKGELMPSPELRQIFDRCGPVFERTFTLLLLVSPASCYLIYRELRDAADTTLDATIIE